MKIDILTSIHELMGLGLTWEAASKAVRYFDGMSEDIRRKQAEKKKKYRADRKAAASSRPLSSSASSDSQEKPKVVSKKEREKKFSSPFPSDFRPTDAHYARGASRGLSRSEVDELAEDIALWARAKGEKKICWGSAFHRWIKTTKKQGSLNGQPTLNQVINRIGQRASNVQPGSGGARPPLALGLIPGGKAE